MREWGTYSFNFLRRTSFRSMVTRTSRSFLSASRERTFEWALLAAVSCNKELSAEVSSFLFIAVRFSSKVHFSMRP